MAVVFTAGDVSDNNPGVVHCVKIQLLVLHFMAMRIMCVKILLNSFLSRALN